jgi:hypothetical protein
MSEKDVLPRRLISSSKSPIVILNALKPVGKLYFSQISETKMPQICSICEKSAYYMAESGVKSALSAVHSGIFGEISMVLTFCSRLATL